MRLYLDDGHYYCFGCGARGDIVQWVRDAEGVGCQRAIGLLDSAARSPTPGRASLERASTVSLAGRSSERNTGDSGEAVRQAELPDLARTHPRASVSAASQSRLELLHLPAAPCARQPPTWHREGHRRRRPGSPHRPSGNRSHPGQADGLVCALRTKGFSDDELVDAGLAYRRMGDDRISDFYRQRVLIPIRDDQGRFAGSSAATSAMSAGRSTRTRPAPTPTTSRSTSTSRFLHPIDAMVAVIVVEGTLDAMAIAVAAIRRGSAHRFCPLTQSGRELSALQVESILRLHPGPLLISFDGDAAGRDSNRRLAAAIQIRGRGAAVINLPDGADPASWLTRFGPAALDTWDTPTAQSAASAASGCDPIHLPAL